MTITEAIRELGYPAEGGAIEYWVEYTPPDATQQEIEDLLQSGFVVPTERLETQHRSFIQR